MKWLGGVVALSALAGCSLIYATDLDDARGPSTPLDAGAHDAASDGSSPVADAAVEAAAAPDASLSGCAAIAPAPKFCDDFDSEANVTDGFSYNHEAGETAFDSTLFVSAPHSAKVTFDTTQGCQYSRLDKYFASVGSNRFEVHFKVQPSSDWQNEVFLAFGLDNSVSANACQFLLYATSGPSNGEITASHVDVQSTDKGDDNRNLNGFPPKGAWTQVDIVVTPIAAGGSHYHIVLTTDGQGAQATDLDFPQCAAWSGADVHPGIHCSTGTTSVNFDDFWVDWN